MFALLTSACDTAQHSALRERALSAFGGAVRRVRGFARLSSPSLLSPRSHFSTRGNEKEGEETAREGGHIYLYLIFMHSHLNFRHCTYALSHLHSLHLLKAINIFARAAAVRRPERSRETRRLRNERFFLDVAEGKKDSISITKLKDSRK